MKKIMNEGRKSKRKWYTNTDLHNSVNINPTNKLPSLHTRRRMIIRDKLFMQHITDMMSMGEVSDIIRGAIEIINVKITADFKYVNVFYIPNNDVSQEALQKCARIIRHELSQLRVIGIVPPIQFVEDKQYYIQKEVERRLTLINFEEEVLSSEQCDNPDSVDQTSHNESVEDNNSKADEFYIQLPVMRHDVLGLDHHRIMSQITSAVSKSKKAAQRRMLDANSMNKCDNSRDSVSKEVEFLTRKQQQKIFSDFLIKRQREGQRRYKSDKRKVLNNFEELNNESNYEDNIDNNIDEYIDEYTDDFEDDTRK